MPSPTPLPIVPFDLRTATDDEIRVGHAFFTQLDRERSPDDPPTTFEQALANVRNIPPFVDIALFRVFLPDGSIGASADFVIHKTEDNQHLAQFGISVLPSLRRQGIGTRLLNEIVTLAEQHGRRLLMAGSNDRVPAGGEFLKAIGATVGLESHTNQLKLTDLDRDLLRRWRENGPPDGYTLDLWTGPYPEENIDEIIALNELMNQVPRGDLEVEDFHWTVEHLRQQEASMVARGIERWTYFVRETATGKIAGYTEMTWTPHRPDRTYQGITAVWPQYRGKGFGRLLKAAMLDKVLKERPQVVLVRTDNADTNAPMLKINTELGFKPYLAESVWQIETARARDYLNTRVK